MNRYRLAVGIAVPLVLAVVLILVLLNQDGGDQPTPPTVAAASTTTPTTPPSPSTTTGAEDWLATMRQLMAFRHSLFTDPRPELLGEVFDRRCPCYAQDYKELTDLRRRGLHYDDQGVQVQSAKLVGKARDPSKPVVAVEVVTRQLPQALVDAEGKVVRELPGSGPTKTIYNLIRGADGRWRAYLIYRGLTSGDSP